MSVGRAVTPLFLDATSFLHERPLVGPPVRLERFRKNIGKSRDDEASYLRVLVLICQIAHIIRRLRFVLQGGKKGKKSKDKKAAEKTSDAVETPAESGSGKHKPSMNGVRLVFLL